jgi:uncharacterized protein
MGDTPLAIPDVNVLVALTNPSHVFHIEAHRWLATVERYATTPVTESGLLRMLLNPAVTAQSVSAEQALSVLRGVRADPRADFLPDDTSLAAANLEMHGLAGHKQVTDWHLLNLAARHGGVLTTFDRKLARTVASTHGALVVALGK